MMETAEMLPGRGRPRPQLKGPPPTAIQKAAIILTAIGPERAEAVLRGVSPEHLKRFGAALASLGTVTQELLDYVIVEFLEALTKGADLPGGADAARRLLGSVLGEDELEQVFGAGPQEPTVWERLNDAPITAIASYVGHEHPQTAAVLLSELRPEMAAGVLERLERAFAREVVVRLSRVPALDQRTTDAVAAGVEKDFLSALQRSLSKRRPAELIAGLMNNISSEKRNGFLAHLEEAEPQLASDVQRSMFTFEHIATRLTGRDVATVVRDLPEDVLLPALKFGQMQGSGSVGRILENVPRRLAERFVEELQAMPEVLRKEGEAAQMEVTKRVMDLQRSGTIAFVDEREDG